MTSEAIKPVHLKHNTITLGGKEYTLSPLPFKRAKVWRAKLRGPLDILLGFIQSVDTTVETPAELVKIAKELIPTVLEAPEIMLDLLCAYSPQVAQDREHIEENAFDEEIIAAFVEVIKLAFPLGQLKLFLGALNPGI